MKITMHVYAAVSSGVMIEIEREGAESFFMLVENEHILDFVASLATTVEAIESIQTRRFIEGHQTIPS